MKQRSIIRQLIFYGIAILLVVLAVSALSTRGTETKAYDDVIKAIENAAGEDQSQWIDTIRLDAKNRLVITFQDKNKASITYKFDEKTLNFFYKNQSEKIEELVIAGHVKSYDLTPATEVPAWLSFVPMILIVIFMIVVWVISANQMNKGGGKFNSFGRAKVKTPAKDGQKVLFRDVAGADEEKEELVEVVEFLKDPQKFARRSACRPSRYR